MPFLLCILALAAVGGGAYAHYVCWRADDRRGLSALVALDALVAVLVAAAAASPPLFDSWMQEDGWAEWATFVAFATACALFAREAYRHGREHRNGGIARAALLVGFGGTALFCLAVAGEEISWGQRLLALQPPEVFLQDNYQQELNVHNMLKGKSVAGFALESKYLVALVAVLYGLVYPAAVRFLSKGDSERAKAFRLIAAPGVLTPAFAAVAWAELAYPVGYTGEAAELVLGIAFAAAALLRRPAAPRPSSVFTFAPAVAVLAVIAAGVLLQPTIAAFAYGGDDARIAAAQRELVALEGSLAEAGSPRLLRKRSVHKRLYTAVRAGYLAFGAPGPLVDIAEGTRARYFLDPWNNPYWVRWSKRDRAVLVYSFGPNRRRDTDSRTAVAGGVVRGDDIARVISLPAPNTTPRSTGPALTSTSTAP